MARGRHIRDWAECLCMGAGASKVIKQGLFRVWSEECLLTIILFRLLGAVAHQVYTTMTTIALS